MPTGYTQVSASALKDATGTLVANATISFAPVDNNGKPTSFRAGGGGQTTSQPVKATVTNGAFTVQLADTTLTSPVNVGYAVTVTDNLTGESLLGPGYGCVQPGGATWLFDLYDPNLASQVTIQPGPQGIAGAKGDSGPQGPQGVAGANGTTTATGASGNFEIEGAVIAESATTTLVNTRPGNVPNGGPGGLIMRSEQMTQYGAGMNDFGNRWYVPRLANAVANFFTRGIKQIQSYTVNSRAAGDSAVVYGYWRGAAGALNGSDEGVTSSSWQVIEESAYFIGSVAVAPTAPAVTPGSGADPTQGNINPTLALASGSAYMVDQTYLINTSHGYAGGTFNGVPASHAIAGGVCNSIPVTGVNVPLSTAYGTVTAGLPANLNNPPTMYVEETITVAVGQFPDGSYKPFVEGYATLGGVNGFTQRTYIQAPSAIDASGNQTMVVYVRNNFIGQTTLFQGGVEGTFLSMDYHYAKTGMRTSFPVLGSLDGVNLLYAGFYAGGVWAGPVGTTYPQQTSGANAGWSLYPGSEIVMLPAQAGAAPTPSSGGASWYQPTLEMNNCPWVVGDNIENPRCYIWSGATIQSVTQVDSPTAGGARAAGFDVRMQGKNLNNAFQLFSIKNLNPRTMYQGDGGYLPTAPVVFNITGPTGTIVAAHDPPVDGSAVVFVGGNIPTPTPGTPTNWVFQQICNLQWLLNAVSGWCMQPISFFTQLYAQNIYGSTSANGQTATGSIHKMALVETGQLIMAPQSLNANSVANQIVVNDTGIYRLNSDGVTQKFIPWQAIAS